ncbi:MULTISPECIES: aminoacyl-tRNA hydrolase [Acidithiobacillus]|jgi:PTH1 family peptidyl-tRNA hydrolase|uniref:Peptidyl-tRNA hydrolase n=3 Tax=Acidithiobacillus ferrooxidans TaxID=920 RepID=PTH_ACIF2|nr:MULTISPECIES: aminoacyl-tRNA hydrolase [Acidithiobacillus]B5EKJ0.1 RecName: Full=Peptidyl-tRNA hydrolase; Short=PTH [Acidithiobacillus ferrooxidans ATCC 53993]B7J502.1 RecName: Full=Peptidyl-tRNA hydrolase; Short=PTH [Acidithiobacillus ferrooxidans ATCC 23270]MCL5957406.1 aminoacyl-tRNA hydrolase [Gammaproteobacteria bacterium]ACH84025.1 Aminoacyl-tRNA hydrolase [Acidithiobacillus ferrooxidans ATCC 53993]ACK78537.1 peptidyl-tRNA hydrolase [Acidithiobacillus ferrooxidans ATCC 23270]MBN67452
MDWLLAGLGNPGAEYARTRHNAGFWTLQTLADRVGASLRMEKRWHCLAATARASGLELGLCMPQDFMNRSGGPVQAMAAFYKVAAERILVMHDELDLPPGAARLKRGGGHGGHNGLRDLDRALGTRDYWRLRIGIGHPGHKDAVIPYVLSAPPPADKTLIDEAIERSLGVLPDFLCGRTDAAQKSLHSD